MPDDAAVFAQGTVAEVLDDGATLKRAGSGAVVDAAYAAPIDADDAKEAVNQLRAAVEFRRPRLFANYAAWLGRVMVARGSSTAEVRRFLNDVRISVIPGSERNIKITTRADLETAQRLLDGA